MEMLLGCASGIILQGLEDAELELNFIFEESQHSNNNYDIY